MSVRMWACGLGVDSVAGIVEETRLGIPIHAILFADVGSEKPETYAFLPVFQEWLRSKGQPPVTVVRYEPKNFKHWPPYRTIGENCLTNGTLPSLAFGFKSCSQKWKIGPQDKWTERWEPALVAWSRGEKVVKLIGYDAGPADSRRYIKVKDGLDPRFDYRYPLRDWGWDRARCKEAIAAAGLPVPPKSACFFCPSTQPEELHHLQPFQLRGIVAMEARAKPRLTDIEGLWRTGCKGARDPAKRKPGMMTTYIREHQLLSEAEVDAIWNAVPKDLIQFQEAYAEGQHMDELSRFIRSRGISS